MSNTETLASLSVTPTSVDYRITWTPSTTQQVCTVTYLGASRPTTLTAPTVEPNTETVFIITDLVIYNQGNDMTGPLNIVDYFWDFGDGTYSYGETAIHTYAQAFPLVRVTAIVTDSKGREWFNSQPIYLDL